MMPQAHGDRCMRLGCTALARSARCFFVDRFRTALQQVLASTGRGPFYMYEYVMMYRQYRQYMGAPDENRSALLTIGVRLVLEHFRCT